MAAQSSGQLSEKHQQIGPGHVEESQGGWSAWHSLASCAFLLTALNFAFGLCAVLAPWWTEDAAGSLLGHEATEGSVGLWDISLTLETGGELLGETSTYRLSQTWDDHCRAAESVAAVCYRIQGLQVLAILAALLELAAASSLLASIRTSPLVLLVVLVLVGLSTICSLAALVLAPVTSHEGLAGGGFVCLVLGLLLAPFGALLTFRAANAGMPGPIIVEPLVKSRGERLEVSIQTEAEERERRRSSLRGAAASARSHRAPDGTPAVEDGKIDSPPTAWTAGSASARSSNKKAADDEHLRALKKLLFWNKNKEAEVKGAREEGISPALIRKAFNEIDKDRTGHIDCQELAKALQECGLGISEAAALRVLNDMDADWLGTIDLREFTGFFRRVEELAAARSASVQRAQCLTITSHACFVVLLFAVGGLILMFFSMSEEARLEQYRLMSVLLITLSLVLAVLFTAVIVMPVLRFAFGPSIANWSHYYETKLQEAAERELTPQGGTTQGAPLRLLLTPAWEPKPPAIEPPQFFPTEGSPVRFYDPAAYSRAAAATVPGKAVSFNPLVGSPAMVELAGPSLSNLKALANGSATSASNMLSIQGAPVAPDTEVAGLSAHPRASNRLAIEADPELGQAQRQLPALPGEAQQQQIALPGVATYIT